MPVFKEILGVMGSSSKPLYFTDGEATELEIWPHRANNPPGVSEGKKWKKRRNRVSIRSVEKPHMVLYTTLRRRLSAEGPALEEWVLQMAS